MPPPMGGARYVLVLVGSGAGAGMADDMPGTLLAIFDTAENVVDIAVLR